MDVISDVELEQTIAKSMLVSKYSATLDSESAHELLSTKMNEYLNESNKSADNSQNSSQSQNAQQSQENVISKLSKDKFVKSMAKSATTSFVRNFTGQITRGILGLILNKK